MPLEDSAEKPAVQLAGEFNELGHAPDRTATTAAATGIGTLAGGASWIAVAPTVITAVGGTAAVATGVVVGAVALPAALVGGLAGYKVYRDMKQRNKEEEELNAEFTEEKLKAANKKLQEMHKDILLAIQQCYALNSEINWAKDIAKEDEKIEKLNRHLEITLLAIQSVRKISGQHDYCKDDFEALVKSYQNRCQSSINIAKARANITHAPSDESSLKNKIESLKFIENYKKITGKDDLKEEYKTIRKQYNHSSFRKRNSKQFPEYKTRYSTESTAIKSGKEGSHFIEDLRKQKKEKGTLSAIGLFFKKAGNRAYSFLGGAGIALTIGGIVLAATGFGLVPGLIMIGAAVGVGIATSAVEYYATRNQKERIEALKNNKAILDETSHIGESLGNQTKEMQLEKSEKLTEKMSAEHKLKLTDLEKIIAEKNKELAKKDEELQSAKQENKDLMGQVNEIKTQVENLKQDNKTLQEHEKEIEIKYQEEIKKVENLENKNNGLQKQLEDMQKKLEEMQSQMQTMKEQHSSTLDIVTRMTETKTTLENMANSKITEPKTPSPDLIEEKTKEQKEKVTENEKEEEGEKKLPVTNETFHYGQK